MTENLSDTLFPDWTPPEFPAWMARLPGEMRYRFVCQFSLMQKTVVELQSDGLENLLPIALVEGEKPKDLRKRIGKAGWRVLHHSKTRTNVMRTKIRAKHGLDWSEILSVRPCNLNFLFGRRRITDASMFAARKAPLGQVRDVVTAYIDTMSMGVEVNPEWSVNRLMKEHDRAALQIKTKGKDKTPWARKMVCRIDGFVFERLVSEYEIVAEGVQQRHCVGSYAQNAKTGGILLFSVSGPHRATLEIASSSRWIVENRSTKRHRRWGVHQLKGFANTSVPRRCRIAANKLAAFITSNGVLQ
jgi:hypothetical protein